MEDRVRIIEKISVQTFGLETYLNILEKFNTTSDLRNDSDFQRMFNGYYKVRRNEKWRKSYYDLFQLCKNLTPNQITFKDIIQTLYDKTGKVEASFTSKMLASIDVNKPIWDKNVLNYLELTHKGDSPKEKIHSAIDVYHTIELKYTTLEYQNFIATFNELLPSYKNRLSDTKKIDCFIWLLGMSKG